MQFFLVGEFMASKIEKNKEYVLTIDGMGYQGEGVGKVEGFTIFVPGAIQGEKVKVKALKVNKNFAFAKLIDQNTGQLLYVAYIKGAEDVSFSIYPIMDNYPLKKTELKIVWRE